jgi:hypothetical protein
VSQDEASRYAEGVRRGGALVSVRASEQDRARIEGLLNESSVDYSESQRRLAKHRMDGVRCRESAYGA